MLSSAQREVNIAEMSRIYKLVARSGWTKRLAKRFDNTYCCYMRCSECDMTRDCPRPHVENFDPDLNLLSSYHREISEVSRLEKDE